MRRIFAALAASILSIFSLNFFAYFLEFWQWSTRNNKNNSTHYFWGGWWFLLYISQTICNKTTWFHDILLQEFPNKKIQVSSTQRAAALPGHRPASRFPCHPWALFPHPFSFSPWPAEADRSCCVSQKLKIRCKKRAKESSPSLHLVSLYGRYVRDLKVDWPLMERQISSGKVVFRFPTCKLLHVSYRVTCYENGATAETRTTQRQAKRHELSSEIKWPAGKMMIWSSETLRKDWWHPSHSLQLRTPLEAHWISMNESAHI